MAANPFLFKLFDLSSVTSVITGAAALSQELAGKLHSLVPKWHFLHGYGRLTPFVWFLSAHAGAQD